MSTNLVLVAGILVYMRRYQHGKLFLPCRKRNRPFYQCPCAARCFDNLLRGGIDETMVESLEAYTNALILHLTELQTINNQRPARESPEKGTRILMMTPCTVKVEDA